MASYLKKEISEWNTKDLCSWLTDNKYPGISELCQNNSLSGYDLFYINEDILKNELGLSSFHERKVTMKLISKLINEHLKLNIINSNGDNVVLTLDNNQDTSLGELSEYIGGMFNIEPKDILYKDFSKKEVLSPTVKIVKLIILYPKLYKTLNVFNMKDYHQINEEEQKNYENDFVNNNNNGSTENENESDYQEENKINKKMNFDYKMKNIEDDRMLYNQRNDEKMNKIIYNDEYDIKNNNKFRSDPRVYRGVKNQDEDDIESDFDNNRNIRENQEIKFRNQNSNIRDNNKMGKDYFSLRDKRFKNFNDEGYQDNYNKAYKNPDSNNNYYDSN